METNEQLAHQSNVLFAGCDGIVLGEKYCCYFAATSILTSTKVGIGINVKRNGPRHTQEVYSKEEGCEIEAFAVGIFFLSVWGGSSLSV